MLIPCLYYDFQHSINFLTTYGSELTMTEEA